MHENRMRCIISGIKKFELTAAEKELIAFAERNLNRNGLLMKKIEPILERVYEQKTNFIRSSILSMLEQEGNRFHPVRMGNNTNIAS